MKITISNETFYMKKSLIEFTKTIMERNINKILSGDDLKFMWELVIMNYPHPDSKKLWKANQLTVKLSPNGSTWLWVIDNEGVERDVSIYKSINNLKWEEGDLNVDYITFGKYKNQRVEDVIDNDIDYFQWLVSQEWLKKPLKDIIEIEFKRINDKKEII